jgi:hypothetical protein
MKQQAKITQLIGDMAIPIIGFYLWDWSMLFILFFYILDVAISTVFTFVKTISINSFHRSNYYPWKHIIIILLGYILSFYLVLYSFG